MNNKLVDSSKYFKKLLIVVQSIILIILHFKIILFKNIYLEIYCSSFGFKIMKYVD